MAIFLLSVAGIGLDVSDSASNGVHLLQQDGVHLWPLALLPIGYSVYAFMAKLTQSRMSMATLLNVIFAVALTVWFTKEWPDTRPAEDAICIVLTLIYVANALIAYKIKRLF